MTFKPAKPRKIYYTERQKPKNSRSRKPLAIWTNSTKCRVIPFQVVKKPDILDFEVNTYTTLSFPELLELAVKELLLTTAK